MLYGLGFALLVLGTITADSDSLVFPFVAILIGSVLVLMAKGRESDDETD